MLSRTVPVKRKFVGDNPHLAMKRFGFRHGGGDDGATALPGNGPVGPGVFEDSNIPRPRLALEQRSPDFLLTLGFIPDLLEF
jgi:hypothetical protein